MSEAETEPVAEAEQPAPPTWELEEELAKLQSYDPAEVTGERRMGAGMAFREAAAQVQVAARMVDEVRLDWDRLGPSKRAEIAGQARNFVANVDAMLKMDSGRVDTTNEEQEWTPEEVRSQRDTYETEITNTYTWLLDNLPPVCVTAPAQRAAQEVVREQAADLSEEQVNALRQTLARLGLATCIGARRVSLGTNSLMPAKKVPHETARRFAELVGLGLTHREAAARHPCLSRVLPESLNP